MKDIKGFIITKQFYEEMFNDLTDKDLGRLLSEICDCVFNQKQIGINGLPLDHALNTDYLQEYFKAIMKLIKVV